MVSEAIWDWGNGWEGLDSHVNPEIQAMFSEESAFKDQMAVFWEPTRQCFVCGSALSSRCHCSQ